MKKKLATIFPLSRGKYIILLAGLLWLKSIFAYLVDFKLSYDEVYQYLILLVNPLGSIVLLLGLTLFIKRKSAFAITSMVVYTLMNALIVFNVLYFREYTDFITINTVLGFGKVASGLGESALQLFRPYDLIYLADYVILIILFVRKKVDFSEVRLPKRKAVATLALSAILLSVNLFTAEIFRPGLLTRTFSREYIVKFLGLNAFVVYDGVETYNTNQVRAEASATDLDSVEEYVSEHYAAPDTEMFGTAEGKNVIVIHLESFQQFLIDYSLVDEDGVAHEVTPFLNSLYHSNSTYSFSNFFNQVSAGRTSDAETLMENSLFGLSEGSLFTKLGSENTFQAAPAILDQTQGYTSAVFHGNSGSFWNRNETYKQFGYDYFFDSSYYDVTDENSFQYGLMDKPFLSQSIQYLEHLQQPFYTKFITVSNHYPYNNLTGDDVGFPLATTSDDTINGYFATANYLDSAIEEFFNYLKESGLYDNSIIVLYGDHYGISNSRNTDLAPLLGQDSATWDDFDNTQMQRVPYMIHVPGATDGYVNDTYGGEVDALPTLLHLLGVDTSSYLQLGQDLFSADNQQLVAFRNGNFITPDYTYVNETIYDNTTGLAIEEPSEELLAQIETWKEEVNLQLTTSDEINNGDLLRFYTDSGLTAVDSSDYNYLNQTQQLSDIEAELGDASTSLYSQNNDVSTVDLFKIESYQEEATGTSTTNSTAETSN
ncbi:LTA synthase family protein [Enterococcus sp. HY326]|uniref:LTA synthase family protein n=1 Tax=Enterococcus sp. HY326 TaxID=2971265 RepID=UPI00223F8CB7|nr:LTA synthase family protein [Enterococcus sp. HY326]